jgi:signal transduction histidine kinase
MLEQFGLVPTLKRHAEQFGARANVEVMVSEEGEARKLSDRIANYLFRSVKELLNNAVKHGNAKQIIARFYWERDGIRVVVDDDGEGFDTAELLVPNSQRGLGLAGIRERLTSLGGDLKLESTPGEGTRVMLELPWERKEVAK